MVSELFQKLNLLIHASRFNVIIITNLSDPFNLETVERKEKNYKKLKISRTPAPPPFSGRIFFLRKTGVDKREGGSRQKGREGVDKKSNKK